jgi:hypothetical protein
MGSSTYRTELCPDVLEAAPPLPGFSNVLAVASYYLAPDGGKTGALGLLRAAGAGCPVTSLCSVPSAAVFDARWAPLPLGGGGSAPALLLSATHGGAVGLHSAEGGGGGGGAPTLAPVGGWLLGGGGGGGGAGGLSALCCEWLGVEGDVVHAASGLSDGRVWAGALRGGCAEGAGACWPAHALRGAPSEVWCAAAKPEPGGARRTVLWSGGDDGALRGWDLRAPAGGGAAFSTRAGAFGGGVTCVSWAPPWGGWDHVAAVGSYDGTLRLWDDRRVGGAAEPLAALPLGGGVWRIKWRDGGGGGGGGWREGRALAAAVMYGGARVVALGGGEGGAPPTLQAAAAYAGHGEGSITYGVEWVGEGARAAVATCAFYEKEVHVNGFDALAEGGL